MASLSSQRKSELLEKLLAEQRQAGAHRGTRSIGEMGLRILGDKLRQRKIDKVEKEAGQVEKTEASRTANMAALAMGQPSQDFMGNPIEGAESGEDALQKSIVQQLKNDPDNKTALALMGRQMDKADAKAKAGEAGEENPFGTGLEGRSMFIQTQVENGTIDADDPIARISRSYLEKPRTIVTPDGTYTQPGLNMDSVFKGTGSRDTRVTSDEVSTESAGPGAFTPNQPSERERTAGFSSRNMFANNKSLDTLIEGSVDFDPTELLNVASNLPFGLGQAVASDKMIQYKSMASQFVTDVVFLRSGATAREEEKTSAFQDLFPQPGNKVGTVLSKESGRLQVLREALLFGARANRLELGEEEMSRRIGEIDQRIGEVNIERDLVNQLLSVRDADHPNGYSDAEIQAILKGK